MFLSEASLFHVSQLQKFVEHRNLFCGYLRFLDSTYLRGIEVLLKIKFLSILGATCYMLTYSVSYFFLFM